MILVVQISTVACTVNQCGTFGGASSRRITELQRKEHCSTDSYADLWYRVGCVLMVQKQAEAPPPPRNISVCLELRESIQNRK